MKTNWLKAGFIGTALLCLATPQQTLAALTWRTACYVGWDYGTMSPAATDTNGLTHIAHFALLPQTNGSVTQPWFTSAQISDVISTFHARGLKVNILVGGAGTGNDFNSAIQNGTRTIFINNLYNFMINNGYDGIDLDSEPIVNGSLFQTFVNELRTKIGSSKLLTVSIGAADIADVVPVISKLDHINIMTYDLSGPWGGWVTWFNNPVDRGGYTFPGGGGAVPCIKDIMASAVSAGIPKAKLGIGISFGAHVWNGGAGTDTGGVSKPRQTWTTAPADNGSDYDVAYKTVMSTYYSAANDHWDSVALVPWIGIDASGSANDKFISYENAESVKQKVLFAQNNGYAGCLIWQLTHDYMPSASDKHPLMTGLRAGLNGGGGGGGTNLVQNPGFESGSGSWTSWGNSSVVAGNAHGGANSMRSGQAAGGCGQDVTSVTASSSYTLSGWGKLSASGGSNYGSLSYTCFNSGGSQLSNGSVTFTTTSYAQKTVTFTAPSSTAKIQVGVWAGGSNYYFYLDDVSLVKN